MTLILEDGTGKADADTFAALADADSFWADRAITSWAAGSDPDREAALRQGFTYLSLAFQWPGQPKLTTQSGCWPRVGAYDKDGAAIDPDSVPRLVRDAAILLGNEALGGNLFVTATADPALSRKDIKIGPISIGRSYDTPAQPSGLKRFPAVDACLAPISKPRGSGGLRTQRLIRA